MNVWLFAGCMFLVAVSLNVLLFIWAKNRGKAENQETEPQNRNCRLIGKDYETE
ncbi:hypothetical protein [Bacillus nitratireducens]|uniref:hypothetical protein n=1 Tax=Bacillus nitratireducens TaxID=2026193 RepID=UPI002E783F4F|nr:hypothetical protein [Bacillus nitratireducens]